MNIFGLIFLLLAHYFCGRGILQLFRLEVKPAVSFCLSMLVGVAALSFIPPMVQLFHIPITATPVFVGILILSIGVWIPSIKQIRMPKFGTPQLPRFYELPFILTFLVLLTVSAWRCYYYAPIPRDLLSGAELIAEYAVREKTFISSIFGLDLTTTNNIYKSPYLIGLQIIYKLLVYPFGQIWLVVIVLNFLALTYYLIREKLNGLIAGFIMLLLIAIPEMFAYTYMVLYDYSNMVFFFFGFYFLARYLSNEKMNEFAFAAFLLGIATYIRTETYVLVEMVVPLLIFYMYRQKVPVVKMLPKLGIYIFVPLAFYLVCNNVFVAQFVPLKYSISDQINKNLSDLSPFFTRMSEMKDQLIFCERGIDLYGYLINIFCFLLVIDVAFFRKFNKESILSAYGILVVFFGMAFLGYFLPLVDLGNTTKRAMFKAFPLIALYMRNSGFLLKLTEILDNWESGIKKSVTAKKAPIVKKAVEPKVTPTIKKNIPPKK